MFIASTWYDHRVIPADRRSVVQETAKAHGSPRTGPAACRLLEPDALVRATLGVEEQADQRAVEQQRDDHREVDDLGAEHGEEHDELEDGSGNGDRIRPLPLVGDPVPADREPDDRHQAVTQARGDYPEQPA